MNSTNPRIAFALMAMLSFTAMPVQSAEPPSPAPAPSPAEPPRPNTAPPEDGLPSLDEALGLEKKAEPKPGDDQSGADTRSDLDKQLADEAAGDDLTQAVGLMDQVASRLEKSSDTGLATQRMQEEAIRKLDKLISEAKKQRQPQKKKPKPQQDKQDQKDQQQQQQQKDKQGNASETQDQNQENRGDAMDPAARRDGALRQLSPGGSAVWGSLPERVRSSLMQGFSDQFSSVYQSMTEAYYRRLAEDRERDRRDPPSGAPR